MSAVIPRLITACPPGLTLLLALLLPAWPVAASSLQPQAQALFGNGQPPALRYSEAEAELGRALFFDARIGRDGTHCGSCHQHDKGGADGRPTAIGAFGRQGKRNTPTVVDVLPQISMHWHGDRESLADQAIRSLTAPPAYDHPDLPSALAVI